MLCYHVLEGGVGENGRGMGGGGEYRGGGGGREEDENGMKCVMTSIVDKRSDLYLS